VVGADVGVEPALVGVPVGTSEMKVIVMVGVGLLFVLLLPPHAASRVGITSPRRQNQVSLPQRDERGKECFGIIVSPFF
jgi:hypothetical protein